jgi:hypothetical protein
MSLSRQRPMSPLTIPFDFLDDQGPDQHNYDRQCDRE